MYLGGREGYGVSREVVRVGEERKNDAYDGSCWLGCVLNVNEQEHAITVTFLHPSIPSASFFYPK